MNNELCCFVIVNVIIIIELPRFSYWMTYFYFPLTSLISLINPFMKIIIYVVHLINRHRKIVPKKYSFILVKQ
jgi:hypothetical protein